MLVIGSFKLAHILKADKISVHMTHHILVECPYRLSISMMDIFGFQVADPVCKQVQRKENLGPQQNQKATLEGNFYTKWEIFDIK